VYDSQFDLKYHLPEQVVEKPELLPTACSPHSRSRGRPSVQPPSGCRQHCPPKTLYNQFQQHFTSSFFVNILSTKNYKAKM